MLPSFTGGIAVVLVILAAVAIGDRIGVRFFAQKPEIQQPEPSGPTKQTEAIFISGLKNEPAVNHEWWAARSDHRLVAYTVFNCKQLADIGVDSMPREYFSALLLDLTPDGNHIFRIKEDLDFYSPFAEKAKLALAKTPPLILTSSDQEFLSLSDSIARARVAAADGANVNVPWVQRLGIATLIVGALATLFVTLQGKMRPVEFDDKEKKKLERATWGRRVRFTLWGPGSGFRWVAFCAITLSIAGTALTGLKQVYDPTRTLTQNTRAMLELRQLHQDVIMGVKCQDKSIAANTRMPVWIEALRRARGTIIPDYGAYANLDVGNTPRPDSLPPAAPMEGQRVSAQAPAAPGQ